MNTISIYNSRSQLQLPWEQTSRLLHFAQYFRLHNLMTAAAVPFGDERYERAYDWTDRLLSLADARQTFVGAVDMNFRTEVRNLERLYNEIMCNVNLNDLSNRSPRELANGWSIGFISTLVGSFYCRPCDATDTLAGLLVNVSTVVNNVSPDSKKVSDWYHQGRVFNRMINLDSCPYCQPANWMLGSWKRLLARQPNICECDACGRY